MPRYAVQPPEWIDAAPVVVERSARIDAPPAAVWTLIADHERWPEWFTQLSKVERIGSGEGVGSGRRVSVGRVTLDEEFTAWDVDEHFAFAVVSAPVPILAAVAESVRLTPDGDGCTVIYRQGLQPRRGFGWLVGQLAKPMGGPLETALDKLRTTVEQETP